jgi:hypothetical protein
MHGSRSKIPSKNSRQAAFRGGINSVVKGLNYNLFFHSVKSEKDNADTLRVTELTW